VRKDAKHLIINQTLSIDFIWCYKECIIMDKNTLKIGDSIENKDKYEGEGELIVNEIHKYGINGIVALNTKYPSLNGQIIGVSNYELQYYNSL